eukprot:2275496-Ditylum_brightwellii.AAC.1
MTNLFKAYLVASNCKFVRYIHTKKEAYDSGDNITVESLITHAKNKCKILPQQGTWNAMPPEQEQIVALASTIEKLKGNNLKLLQRIKGGGTNKKGDKHKKGKRKAKTK